GRHHIAQYVGVYGQLASWAASAGIVRERIHVIDNALNLSQFDLRCASRASTLRQQLAIAKELPLGIFVGGIRPDKGVDVLLNALALSQYHGEFKILLIGGERDPDYAAACRAQCRMLGLEHIAIFAGQRADAAALLSQCDFAVLSSR